MLNNLGLLDRIIRLGLAIFIIFLYYTNVIFGPIALVLLLVFGVFIFTSLTGFCPLYFLIRISTKKNQEDLNHPF
jgi:hypothetical protein